MSQISKILIRSGTNFERLCAEDVGVRFSNGEPGWVYDTKRLYVGDGSQVGGYAVGMRNLGAVNTLFGSFAGTGYSQEGYYALLSGVEVGDILYDRDTRILYSLTGRSQFPPLTSELIKYDFTVQIYPDHFFFNANDEIQIKREAIIPELISSSIADGATLTKPLVEGPIQIANKGVQNNHLADMPAYAAKVNVLNVAGEPTDLIVGPKQFVGRSSTSTLTALGFETILAEANITTINGVALSQPNPVTSIFSLSASVFDVRPNNVVIYPSTSINSSLTATGRVVFSNTLTVSGASRFAGLVYANEITTRNGRVNAGTAIVSGGDFFCRDIYVQGPGGVIINGGATANLSLNGGSIVTNNGSINTGTGNINCNNIYAAGDIIAFFTSDKRLKTNIQPLESSLFKLDNINAYTFEWDNNEVNKQENRVGGDIGVLAQEVQTILPQAVLEKEDGYLHVNYQKLIPFLISCVRELKEEVNSLKNEIRQLSQ
jgi:hypothetical protein